MSRPINTLPFGHVRHACRFQSFCQYRGKVTSMSPEELETLKRCDKASGADGSMQRAWQQAAEGVAQRQEQH